MTAGSPRKGGGAVGIAESVAGGAAFAKAMSLVDSLRAAGMMSASARGGRVVSK